MSAQKVTVATQPANSESDFQFTPTRNFHSPELDSHYCVGLTYRVRDGNTKLAGLVKSWLADGRIVKSPVAAAVKGG